MLLLIISGLFGLAWFLLLYGIHPLDLTNVDWIYNAGGDLFQHQLGWEWFRQEPWRFPLGRIEAYGYPYGTSISYMDSIPLFAILFKLLSPLLHANFQYLGLWELTSLIGQIFFGVLILGEFTPSTIKKLLGAFLLVLSPALIFRAFSQDSLTAHWILLAGIWFIVREYKDRLWRGSWVVLFAIAMLVHLYFVVMLLPLWAISLFFLFKREKSSRRVLLEIIIITLLLLFEGYCLGLFTLSLDNLESWGYGYYSWNLNGFINPYQTSAFLKQLAVGLPSQYEGYSYLGLGNLIILPFALGLFFHKDASKRHLHVLIPFILVFIITCLFSLSNKGFFNSRALWDIRLPNLAMHLCALFRSSGRFVWPAFYFLVLFGLISIIRNFRFATPLLVLVLMIQVIDIQPLYSSKKPTGFSEYQNPLQSEFWQSAASANKHMILLPTNLYAMAIYEPLALLARNNDITLNWGYFARGDYVSINNDANLIWQDLGLDKADKQTLYIFWDSDWNAKVEESLSESMVICQVDGYKVVLSEENALVQSNPSLSSYCTLPKPDKYFQISSHS
jgi:hypothetical protein